MVIEGVKYRTDAVDTVFDPESRLGWRRMFATPVGEGLLFPESIFDGALFDLAPDGSRAHVYSMNGGGRWLNAADTATLAAAFEAI